MQKILKQTHDAVKFIASNRIGLTILPSQIEDAYENVIQQTPKSALKESIQRINNSLTSTGSVKLQNLSRKRAQEKNQPIPFLEPHTISYDKSETAAYVAVRAIPSYAASHAVLKQLSKRTAFNPNSITDFGSGPGTSIWAALDIFPTLQKATFIDLSQTMLEVIQSILESFPKLQSELKRYLPLSTPSEEKSDLVIAAFVLSELPNDQNRKITIQALWNQTSDILVLIDRGTPVGSSIIQKARQEIIDSCLQKGEKLHIIAPCPHEQKCPMIGNKHGHWCHFSQKVQINQRMRQLKSKKQTQEDVKYSFVILRKGERPAGKIMNNINLNTDVDVGDGIVLSRYDIEESTEIVGKELVKEPWPVMTLPPLKRNKHVVIDTCSPNGNLERRVVSNKKSSIYTHARKSYWGDLWPHKHEGTIVKTNVKVDVDVEVKTRK
jgi:ribosomal protein RSM22 (predicted rRNA methylase)